MNNIRPYLPVTITKTMRKDTGPKTISDDSRVTLIKRGSTALLKVQQGFSMVELMVAVLISLLITYAVLKIYLVQSQLYKTSTSQDVIQSTENAIVNLVTPVIRSTGFTGCGTVISAISNLNAGGPSPIATINTNPIMLMGYSGSGTSYTITQDNRANDSSAGDWSPSLEPTLVGNIEKGNDVIIVFGSAPGSYPTGVTTIDPTSSSLTVETTAGTSITSGQFAAVSDCGKTVIFQITGVSGNTISHASGTGILANASSDLTENFSTGSQFIQLQQTAFFVGQGQGGQSSLMRAILVGNTWNIQPIVPGVEFMQVEYGIGSNGIITQYVPASSVTDWAQVYAVRMGFLIEGQVGSGTLGAQKFTVLDTTVTVPADNRIRHVFEITINLRNALS
ncbi:PilW family protein [Legionella fallonii]|uniref:Type IV fimbrial biogenesis PilW related protein, transmembrane n=1 Tax=Legionella fallonii LLAP-10 TaxID=1212491 RepID=A0A098G7S6_9GAMM|nr:PilW family protein [Legionella fallonii]CEG58507.1 Type IV fimbrial biogenesis PilW related protein, transmembrane [Legionella fallonii LLAP-10]